MASSARGVGIGLAIAAVVVLGGGLAMMLGAEIVPDAFETVAFDTLDPSQARWVRVEGTAHYQPKIKQTTAGSLFKEPGTWWVFPFLPEGDNAERAVPVLVRTRREPERIISFETMTIEGRLSVPSKDRIPHGTETLLGQGGGYFYADTVWLLEPVRIVSDDGVWEEPGWE